MAHRLVILIAIGRETARILQQTRRMHQVPAQDCRVSLGEGVLAACGRSILALIAIAQTWTDLADPARIRLGRNGIADMGERVLQRHGGVLDPVLIAGDHAAARLAVIDELAIVLALSGLGIEPLDQNARDRAFLAQPERRADHQNVRRLHLLPDLGPVITLPALLGHVGLDAKGDLVIHKAHALNADTLRLHDGAAHMHQIIGVRGFGRALERAVDEKRLQIVIAGGRSAVRVSHQVSLKTKKKARAEARARSQGLAISHLL